MSVFAFFLLGSNYMANFSPGWNFWKAVGGPEILLQLHDEFQPERNEITWEKSLQSRWNVFRDFAWVMKFTFQPGLKFDCIYLRLFIHGLAGMKVPALFELTELELFPAFWISERR